MRPHFLFSFLIHVYTLHLVLFRILLSMFSHFKLHLEKKKQKKKNANGCVEKNKIKSNKNV